MTRIVLSDFGSEFGLVVFELNSWKLAFSSSSSWDSLVKVWEIGLAVVKNSGGS